MVYLGAMQNKKQKKQQTRKKQKKTKQFSRYKRGNKSFRLSRGLKMISADVNVNTECWKQNN